MQKSSYKSKISRVIKIVLNREKKTSKSMECPSLIDRLLQSREDQRDFREFLENIGLPDHQSYVEFIIRVRNLDQIDDKNDRDVEIYRLYDRYLKPFATEKLQIDWATKAKIETRIKNKPISVRIFDEAAVISFAKIHFSLLHFYKCHHE